MHGLNIGFLKSCIKKDLLKSQLTENEMRDIHYLGQNGCIEYEDISENDDYIHTTDTRIILKPQGKAVYETYVRNRKRWLIPVVISIIAALISLCALYKSSQPVKIYLNNESITDNSVSNNAMPDM